jgi:hypothetical protein
MDASDTVFLGRAFLLKKKEETKEKKKPTTNEWLFSL